MIKMIQRLTRGSQAARRRKNFSHDVSRSPVRLIVAGIAALAFAFPIVWVVIGGFKTFNEANASPPVLWPTSFTLENFTKLDSSSASLSVYLVNSLLVTAMTVVITTIAATLAGYGFARFRFVGSNVVFALTIAVLLVPYPALLVSLFQVMIWLQMTNSLLGLALIYSTFQLPFAVYMMRNSFESIPEEIVEAAELDGLSRMAALPRVMLPLVKPGAVTVALFAFLAAWNEFLAALVLLNNNQSFTLPIALVNAQNGPLNTIDWGALQAGITVSMLPSVVLFIVLQRYYVAGLVAGTGK